MTTVRLENFTGAYPRVDKRLLKDGAAQSAQNLFLTSGRLDPVYASTVSATTRSGTIASVYRMYSGTTDYWLNWTQDVDVARSPIAGDTSFRAYFTSSSFEPRVTNLVLATSSAPYPTAWYVLGVTPPTTTPIIAAVGGAASNVSRAYVYTFVTQWGEESAPSPASAVTTAHSDATWTVTCSDVAPVNTYTVSAAAWSGGSLTLTCTSTFGLRAGEYVTLAGFAPTSLNASWQVASVTDTTHFKITMADPGVITDGVGTAARDAPHNTTSMTKRLYRSVTDTAGNTDYYYVKEVAVATTAIVDDVTTLGEAIPTTGWLMPPVDLQGLRSHPSGALVGFSGNTFCMSEPYAPYAWQVSNQLGTDSPVVGLGVFGQTTVVCTSGRPCVATGVTPETTTLEKLDYQWPCLAKRGIVVANGGVYYPTSLGLAFIDANGPRLVTEPFYAQRDWNLLSPSTFVGASYDGDYYAKYTASGSTYVLVISDKNGVSTLNLQPDTIYTDPGTGSLYAVYNQNIYLLNGNTGVYGTFSWQSKELYLPLFVSLGAARIEADFGVTAAQAAAIAAYNTAVTASNALMISSGLTGGPIGAAYVGLYAVAGSALQSQISSNRTLTFTLYVDQAVYYSRTVTSNSNFRLPSGKKYNNFSISVAGNAPVEAIVVADTMEGLKVV
jgi:hypothetical protein